jgi:hypothetical protein
MKISSTICEDRSPDPSDREVACPDGSGAAVLTDACLLFSKQALMGLPAHAVTHENAVIYRDWFGLGIDIGIGIGFLEYRLRFPMPIPKDY